MCGVVSVYPYTLWCVGGGETVTAVSPMRRRTTSGTSADTTLPSISVSLSDLASYVHQLRSYLPKASTLIEGKGPDGTATERARADNERDVFSRSDSYAAEFMDRNITSRWDKQKPKASCVKEQDSTSLCYHVPV